MSDSKQERAERDYEMFQMGYRAARADIAERVSDHVLDLLATLRESLGLEDAPTPPKKGGCGCQEATQ